MQNKNTTKQHKRRHFQKYARMGIAAGVILAVFLCGFYFGGVSMRARLQKKLSAAGNAENAAGELDPVSAEPLTGGAPQDGDGPDAAGNPGTGGVSGAAGGLGTGGPGEAENPGTGGGPGQTGGGQDAGGASGEMGGGSAGLPHGGKEEGDYSWIWEEAPLLLLVNKDHKLPDDYDVRLIRLPDKTNYAAEAAYGPLMEMLSDGRREGLNFEVCSSYRSVERQQELLDEDIDALMRQGYSYQEAYDEVTMETMPPGHSEHSTGLAFDIVALDYQMLDEEQESTEENKWLKEHCAEYGFILRYPKGREDVTGITFESWHFRYVGKDAAAYIMENDLTLEEYLEELADGKWVG